MDRGALVQPDALRVVLTQSPKRRPAGVGHRLGVVCSIVRLRLARRRLPRVASRTGAVRDTASRLTGRPRRWELYPFWSRRTLRQSPPSLDKLDQALPLHGQQHCADIRHALTDRACDVLRRKAQHGTRQSFPDCRANIGIVLWVMVCHGRNVSHRFRCCPAERKSPGTEPVGGPSSFTAGGPVRTMCHEGPTPTPEPAILVHPYGKRHQGPGYSRALRLAEGDRDSRARGRDAGIGPTTTPSPQHGLIR